ncbi:peptidyl-tRNA hydrolase domain-like protein [Hesseltinella vesiculosa]|uniref:Peptidyl-tRNA hydrolase domain-like protein n=1 Tax=Hesseltinella vesiculosa TaxID=101127 RepID=A0A1X2GMM5_9FUNG|nr:peptidyl-tRNA hydrolase domain-like protein [Hesseltinella vesiculosa]
MSTARQNPLSYDEAVTWIQQFSKSSIPRDQVTASFSRSSGPGGQNVNKVNSKVSLRLQLDRATWIPPHALQKLKTSPLVNKAGELQTTSDRTRSQGKNLQDCYDKLIQAIKQAVTVNRPADLEALAKIEKR